MISKPSLGALTLFAVALATYTWTLAPTVTLVDSGELIAAAKFFGNAHPPGFPLYLVMANLATLVPFGNVAVRVNFASAVFAAAAAAILYRVVTELLLTSSASTYESKNKRSSGKKFARRRATVGDPGSVPIAKPGNQRLPLHAMMSQLLPAMGAGLLLAFSRTLWSYATIAEVYTLNSLLIVLIFLLMLRWRNRIQADRGADRLLYLAAVLFGLALGVHHVTVALILPALAVIVYRAQGINFFTSRRLLFAALFSFAALVLIYCYLPL